MSDPTVIIHTWMWVCPKCGARDGPFAEEEYALAAAERHRDEECVS
jgi:hypothetical protein